MRQGLGGQGTSGLVVRMYSAYSGRLRAVGSVLQRGRRTALAEAKLYDGSGKLVAYASSSCMIFS